MAAFSLRLDLAMEVNHHFLETSMATYHFLYSFELSRKFLYVE